MNVNCQFHPVETEPHVKIAKVTTNVCVLNFGREKTAKTVGVPIYPTRGSTVSVGNEALPRFPLEWWTCRLGFFGPTEHQ